MVQSNALFSAFTASGLLKLMVSICAHYSDKSFNSGDFILIAQNHIQIYQDFFV
jgi:hypothetical protein